MEIISPKIIWREWDSESEPLNESIISECSCDDKRTISVYFDGEKSSKGVTRIFSKVESPSYCNGKFVIIMPEVGTSVSDVDVSMYTEQGYASMVVDYSGVKTAPFYTHYPRDIKSLNFTDEHLSEAPRDARNNIFVTYTKVLMRAVTFAKSYLCADKICVVGYGVGSDSIWKACAFDNRVCAGVSFYGSGVQFESDDENLLGYEAGLQYASYAPLVKVPLLVMACSNDDQNSIDEISSAYELLDKSVGGKLAISERIMSGVGYSEKGNLLDWLNHYLNGKQLEMSQPTLNVSVSSDGKLYYEIKAVGSGTVKLMVSQGTLKPALRNWHSAKIEKIGEFDYISHAEVYDSKKPIYAFAKITDGQKSICSPVIGKIPYALGVKESDVKSCKLIYDSETGEDDFVAVGGDGSAVVAMACGAFELEGVSVTGGSLVTYKIADKRYQGGENDLLGISMYSESEQDVDVVLCCELDGELVEFKCGVEISSADNWLKVNLNAKDFVSNVALLSNWSNIVYLKFCSENKIIVKSIMWV